MYWYKRISKHKLKNFSGKCRIYPVYHKGFPPLRQEKKELRRKIPPQKASHLSLSEGLAVGALVHGRICLMGAHQNLVQRAIVLVLTVVSTVFDGAFDALVCMTVHTRYLLLFGTPLVWPKIPTGNEENNSF